MNGLADDDRALVEPVQANSIEARAAQRVIERIAAKLAPSR